MLKIYIVIRELIDRILLSDYKWKMKYCPTLAKWVFGTDNDRKEMWDKIMENTQNSRTCPNCYGIYWDKDCPECNGRGVCGGYILGYKK